MDSLHAARKRLLEWKAISLLNYFDHASPPLQEHLAAQLLGWPVHLLPEQVALLHPSPSPFSPLPPLVHPLLPSSIRKRRGRERLAEGRTALCLLAGGQGSRLGSEGPKGLFPIGPCGESLFELLGRKLARASAELGSSLPLGVMVGPKDVARVAHHFEEKEWFGLNPEEVSLFPQRTQRPLMTLARGELFLQDAKTIAIGPAGNGVAFQELVAAGVAERWSAQGIEELLFLPIDNPLADPADEELIGALVEEPERQLSVRVLPRLHQEEKAGLMGWADGGIRVVEYSEIDPATSAAYRFVNSGIFALRLSYLLECTSTSLPLHLAKKQALLWNQGKAEATKEFCWKVETFIFDHFPGATGVGLWTDRGSFFAPLKEREGPNGIEAVRARIACALVP